MKNIMLLILTALIIVGCEYRSDAEREEAKHLNGFNTIIIDSCEYCKVSGYAYFSHKGNCHFCQERRQKELEKIITELKEK